MRAYPVQARVGQPAVSIAGLQLLRSLHSFPEGWYLAAAKRVLDVVGSMLLLLVAVPLMLVAAALVKLTSAGPVLYSQVRLGKHGRCFRMYKIRTMTKNCEAVSGIRWSVAGDPRVTPVGRLLRRTHVDELPQLWNVLKGEMSLVGPRPERPEIVPGLEGICRYGERLRVLPGITGLAQVQHGPDTDLESVRHKLVLDLLYTEHCGPWIDVRIVLATAIRLVGVPPGIIRAALWLPGEEAAPGPVPLVRGGPAERGDPAQFRLRTGVGTPPALGSP